MAAAASQSVQLTPEQRQKAVFPFNSDERLHWNFIPTEAFPRNGLLLREMNETQRQRAHDLLKASLSQSGYRIATATMQNETLLGAIEAAERATALRINSHVPEPLRLPERKRPMPSPIISKAIWSPGKTGASRVSIRSERTRRYRATGTGSKDLITQLRALTGAI